MSVNNSGKIEKPENNLIKVMSYTLDKVQELADANSVLGEKIDIDGTTIIPVSKISVGFAGGGADLVDANKKKKQTPVGSGGNVTVTPMTFLVIDEDGVRTVNIAQEKKNSTVADIINALMEQLKASKEEKAAQQKSNSEA